MLRSDIVLLILIFLVFVGTFSAVGLLLLDDSPVGLCWVTDVVSTLVHVVGSLVSVPVLVHGIQEDEDAQRRRCHDPNHHARRAAGFTDHLGRAGVLPSSSCPGRVCCGWIMKERRGYPWVCSQSCLLLPSRVLLAAPLGPGQPKDAPHFYQSKTSWGSSPSLFQAFKQGKGQQGTSRSSLQRYELSQCVIKQIILKLSEITCMPQFKSRDILRISLSLSSSLSLRNKKWHHTIYWEDSDDKTEWRKKKKKMPDSSQ